MNDESDSRVGFIHYSSFCIHRSHKTMPLRNSILASPETLADMLLAADDRYQEAEDLLEHQRFDGCVYLFGYSAEMWLKAVCLRLRSIPPAGIVMSALPPLKKWMKAVAPQVTF